MKVYVEEIEDLSTHGVTVYSLVQGMDIYRAEVRASGITIWERDDYDQGKPLDEEHEQYEKLKEAVVKESYNG